MFSFSFPLAAIIWFVLVTKWTIKIQSCQVLSTSLNIICSIVQMNAISSCSSVDTNLAHLRNRLLMRQIH